MSHLFVPSVSSSVLPGHLEEIKCTYLMEGISFQSHAVLFSRIMVLQCILHLAAVL